MLRRIVFVTIGLLEVAAAGVFVMFAYTLPSTEHVEERVGRVETVGRESGKQVQQVKARVHDLRERRPQMHSLAERLRDHTKMMSNNLNDQRVDYDTVRNVHDALGDAAQGLDTLGKVVDPKAVGSLGDGLGVTADFLDTKVAPGADKAAAALEKTTEGLTEDAQRLSALLKQAPLDLKAAKEVHDSLGKFGEGLDRMSRHLDTKNLEAMKEGFKGLETSLTTGAEQVEKLAGHTYPVVRFNGLKPVVEPQPFWPEGGTIAEGMRKAAKGTSAAAQEMEKLTEDLPRLQESLKESRKVVEKTREALGTALAQQEKVEPLLKNVPEHTARLAEELPKLGQDLAKILRDTAKMREVAKLLREAQKGIEQAVKQWPELQKNLSRSAELLRATQMQLKTAIENREDFERSMKQTLDLADAFASALPDWTEQLERDLAVQEESLGNLEKSIDQVNDAIPEAGRTAVQLITLARLLTGIMAVIFALHGLYVGVSVWLPAGPRV